MPKSIVIFSDGTGQAGGINFDDTAVAGAPLDRVGDLIATNAEGLAAMARELGPKDVHVVHPCTMEASKYSS